MASCAVLARLGRPGTLVGDAGVDVVVTGVSPTRAPVAPGDLYAALPGRTPTAPTSPREAAAAGAVAVLTDRRRGPRAARPRASRRWWSTDPRAVLGDAGGRGVRPPDERPARARRHRDERQDDDDLPARRRPAGRGPPRPGWSAPSRRGSATRCVPSVRTTPEAPDLQALLALMVERGLHRGVDGGAAATRSRSAGSTGRRSTSPSSPTSARTTSTSTRRSRTTSRRRPAVHPGAGAARRGRRRRRVRAAAGSRRRHGPGDDGLAGRAPTGATGGPSTSCSRRDGSTVPRGRAAAASVARRASGCPGAFNVANALRRRRRRSPPPACRCDAAAAGSPRWPGSRGGWSASTPGSRSSRSSTTRTRPTPCARCSTAVRASWPGGSSSCSAAAATATRTSGPLMGAAAVGRRRRGGPHRATTRGRRTRRRSSRRCCAGAEQALGAAGSRAGGRAGPGRGHRGRRRGRRPGDAVVVAGKGHETGQEIAGRRPSLRRPGRAARGARAAAVAA